MGGEDVMPTWQLYSLMIGQLRDDGYSQAADLVSSATVTPVDVSLPKHRLQELLRKGLAAEGQEKKKGGVGTAADLKRVPPGSRLPPSGPPTPDFSSLEAVAGNTRSFSPYDSKHVTDHKGVARCARFSPNGRYFATGSADTTIKLMEVDKLYPRGGGDAGDIRPVIRSFFDHAQAINDVDFHPHSAVLVSGAKDNTIKFFDFAKPSGRRAFRVIQDTHNVRSVSFHPGGEFVLAGTEHTIAHLYDVNTFQCYLSASVQDTHLGGSINQVRYNSSGSMYATCSADGGVRLWDGVNARCVRPILNAHGTADATSAKFTRDERYVLTCGKDSAARLWEVGSGRLIRTYKGGTHTSTKCQAVFSYKEDFVMCVDELTNEIMVWDSVSGELSGRFASRSSPRWLEHSPTEAAFLTCGYDKSVRFWRQERPPGV